jgi:hypothetical protein
MFKTTDINGRVILVTLEELIRIEEAQQAELFAMASHDAL